MYHSAEASFPPPWLVVEETKPLGDRQSCSMFVRF